MGADKVNQPSLSSIWYNPPSKAEVPALKINLLGNFSQAVREAAQRAAQKPAEGEIDLLI